MAEKACHVFTSTTRFGLTQALGGNPVKTAFRCLIAILAGLFIAWLISVVGEPPRTFSAASTSPVWQLLLKGFTMALALCAPAFVAGFLSNRYGWLVGAITALIGQAFSFFYTGAPAAGEVRDVLITYGMRSVVLSMLAGEAGHFLRQRWPPNNSFNPMPLRGTG